MKPKDLIKKYGNQRAVALKFGFTPAAVSLWVKNKRIPPRTQLALKAMGATTDK